MRLSGHTQPFAVIGHPIGHTLSPVMHNAAFAELGMDAIYQAFDVLPERLPEVLTAMQAMGFAGVNLTVPHKEIGFRELANLDDSARLVGAVNTVTFGGGVLTGYNTDGYGFLRAVEEAFGAGVAGASLFLLGTGGAGRAVALVSAREGARALTLADLDAERAHKVASEVTAACPAVEVRVVTDGSAAGVPDADLVVQATPVGMKPGDPSLLEPEAFQAGQRAFDLIYNLPETPFMKAAREGGAETANGLGMLLHQGARAFSLWTGREAPTGVMRAALEEAVYGT
jgi:shikimate dehydrogenase